MFSETSPLILKRHLWIAKMSWRLSTEFQKLCTWKHPHTNDDQQRYQLHIIRASTSETEHKPQHQDATHQVSTTQLIDEPPKPPQAFPKISWASIRLSRWINLIGLMVFELFCRLSNLSAVHRLKKPTNRQVSLTSQFLSSNSCNYIFHRTSLLNW